jgi:hypothetical protein
MKVVADRHLRVLLPSRVLELQPGTPCELPDEDAERLLAKIPERVRAVTTDMTVEPAIKPDGSPLSAVYWESGDGTIRQGWPVLFGMERVGEARRFWIGVEYDNREFAWVHETRLRNAASYQTQKGAR